MRKSVIICLLGFAMAGSVTAAEETIAPQAVCSVDGCREIALPKPRYSDASAFSVQQVWSVVDEILAVSGLLPNFQVVATDEVGNAAAVVIDGERYLAFNPEWIATYKSDPNARWQLYGVMAHEVGHHLQGHTITGTGSRPPTELEADEYAGFVLAALGATLDQAQSLWATLPETGSVTHPPRHQRFDAVERGWLRRTGLQNRSDDQTAERPATTPEPTWTRSDEQRAYDACTAETDVARRLQGCTALIENTANDALVRDSYIMRGQINRTSGAPEDALADLSEAERRGALESNNRVPFLLIKGRTYNDLGQHRQAESAFDTILGETDLPAAWVGLAQAQGALGQTDLANESYRLAAFNVQATLEDRWLAQKGINALNPDDLPMILPESMVASFYDLDPGDPDFDYSITGFFSESPYLYPPLARLLASDGLRDYPMLDFDPIVAGQDALITDVSISWRIREEANKPYTFVTASFKNFGEPTEVLYVFGVSGGIWKLRNILSEGVNVYDILYEAGPVALPPVDPAPTLRCDFETAHPKDVAAVAPAVAFNSINVTDAIRECLEATRRYPNEMRFAYQLARAYDKAGHDVQALRQYGIAASRGYLQAMVGLAILHENGEGTPKNEFRASEWYEAAAEQGHVNAMYDIGKRYQDGLGVPQDDSKAFTYFSWAAQQGHAASANKIGYMYGTGTSVAMDTELARFWFYASADAGYALGKYNVGVYLDQGNGGPRDPAEAAFYLVEAVEGGSSLALQGIRDGTLNLQRDTITEIQKILRAKGVYSGALDGKTGQMTARAISALAPS